MRRILLLILLIAPLILSAITREVSLDGTHQYTSIQSAIDASSNGDIIVVYPGEYFEHLNTGGRNITIQSTYPVTQSEETIDNTIIHANVPYSCLEVNSQETVTINGFTMVNNSSGDLGVYLYNTALLGGGIEVYNLSSIQILNCVIKNSIGRASGGLYFEGLNFYMSNTKIFDNFGIENGGGISLYGNYANSIEFDSEHPNSIYNNTGLGMDVSISNWSNPINIVFHTFSTIITQPDYFYFRGPSTVSISVQNAYFNLINHDLYVSPTGDDTNSGLTPDSPLQTIAYATKIIESDNINPKTIHLAPGIYNFSESNQFYPFSLKANTRLIGEEMDSTIMDSEQSLRRYISVVSQNNVHIENITFIPLDLKAPPIGMGTCDNVLLRNLMFNGNCEEERIHLSLVTNAICENIIVSNSTVDDLNEAFRLYSCSNLILNNILINNLDILGFMANTIGLNIMESDVTIRNSIISNCEGEDVSVLFYQNIEENQASNSLDLSNLLIYNNLSTESNAWSGALIYLSNRFQNMNVTNCTIANNDGASTCVVIIKGDCAINNSIIYNPGNYYDVFFTNVYGTYTHNPSINYSLIRSPYGASNMSLVDTSNVMIDIDPLFLGSNVDTLNMTQSDYYQLYFGSVCINAGIPDTTGLNLPAMDLAGNQRVWDGRIDMGCYEYGAPPVSNDDPELPVLENGIRLSIYPNPVYLNGSKGSYSFIEFTLPRKAKEPPVVEIYNLKGQKVKSITLNQSYNDMVSKAGLSKDVNSGGEFYSSVFDCKDSNSKKLASGIYIVYVTADGKQASSKITVLK